MKRLALALAFVLLGTWLAVPTSASTYYDYWSYWHEPPGATAWQYSNVGASGYRLQQGTQVEGWRYAIGTGSPSDPKPRPVDVTYDDYCKDKNTSSTYRVLLVVDYGTQSGAPSGPVYSCYGFDSQVTGYDVLTQQHVTRESGGLICGIDGYPKTGCGDVVSSPAPKPTTHASTPKPAASTSPMQSTSVARGVTSPASAPASSNRPQPSRPPASDAPTATPTTTTSPPPSGSPSIVAKQFVPPRGRGVDVPYGFIAACLFVAALIGAIVLQRRRRAG